MKRSIFSLLGLVLLASACSELPMDEGRAVQYYSNIFAFNIMNTYYLWKDEPNAARVINNWDTFADAVEQVDACRSNASKLSKKALWKEFIKYYYEAYDIALRHAQERINCK